MKFTFKYYLNRLFCGKFFKSEQNQLLAEAQDLITKDLDIYSILNNVKEIEKFKNIVFDRNQKILFNYQPKPVIKLSLNKSGNPQDNDYEDENTLKQGQNDIGINCKILGKIAQAKRKFLKARKPRGLIKASKHPSNVKQYQKLYVAYEQIIIKQQEIINQRLINELGYEMKDIFETSKLIKFEENKSDNPQASLLQKLHSSQENGSKSLQPSKPRAINLSKLGKTVRTDSQQSEQLSDQGKLISTEEKPKTLEKAVLGGDRDASVYFEDPAIQSVESDNSSSSEK